MGRALNKKERVYYMAKTGLKIYVAENDIAWLDNFPLRDTRGATITAMSEWAITQFRRGARTAFMALDLDERKAVIASMNGTIWDVVRQGADSLAYHMEDWFRLDAGMGWGWSESKIITLLAKIKALSPAEVAGLICWANGFWQDCVNQELDKYADDISRLM